MKKQYKLILFLLLGLSLSLSIPQAVEAQSIQAFLNRAGIPDGQIVPKACTDGASVEECGLPQVYQLIVNVSFLILMITGPILMLMFIYGGVLWIIAAGNQERIQQGKAAIQAAVIGLILVLGAWLIVNLVINSLAGADSDKASVDQHLQILQ